MSRRHSFVAMLLAVFASVAAAQRCPATDAGVYPSAALPYPINSDRYAVQYKLDGGDWTDVRVYVSIYGGANSSPYEPYTMYPRLPSTSPKYPSYPNTSMSFVSIPARANAEVQLRVTKLWDAPFRASDHVSVRPQAKGIFANLMGDGSVQILIRTASDFGGEQFVLWWNRGAEGGGVQGLAFFLDPPYARPAGANVKVVTAAGDLKGDLSAFDTLDFEGKVALEALPGELADPEGDGAQLYNVPTNINSIFLGPGSWVQGKLRFAQSGAGHVRRIYGPGVLDGSRFNYMWRQCRDSATYPEHRADGLQAVSWNDTTSLPDQFVIDGIIVSDIDYTATGNLVNGVVNNVKVIGWNGNNDGLQMADGTRASNVFIRTGDDSLEMWGRAITVTNATVWQNATGGVVNLGWLNKFPGDFDLIDGLYVVRTDWPLPTDPSWTTDPTDLLAHQDNAVIASLMAPGTNFGKVHPPVYRNIFVDDPPRVFLSLKILPPDCDLAGLKTGGCPAIDLTQPSVVNLNIENVFTPQSIVQNSIGFQRLPAGFSYDFPAGITHTLATDFTFTGTMNIGLTNVFINDDGIWLPLLSFDALGVGKIGTNGDNVNITYRIGLP